MDVRVVQQVAEESQRVAEENRQLFRRAGVFAVNLMGAAGAGKTSLVHESLARLVQTLHIGAIACDPETTRDADRLSAYTDQVVQVDTGEGHLLEARHVHEAVRQLDLNRLDLVFIENISSMIGPGEIDLGEDARIGMFSVPEGDDKPSKYPDMVSRADVLILNKVDLLPAVSFDLGYFRSEIRRLNPDLPMFEVSVLRGEGIEPWLGWLRERIVKRPSNVSHWFG